MFHSGVAICVYSGYQRVPKKALPAYVVDLSDRIQMTCSLDSISVTYTPSAFTAYCSSYIYLLHTSGKPQSTNSARCQKKRAKIARSVYRQILVCLLFFSKFPYFLWNLWIFIAELSASLPLRYVHRKLGLLSVQAVTLYYTSLWISLLVLFAGLFHGDFSMIILFPSFCHFWYYYYLSPLAAIAMIQIGSIASIASIIALCDCDCFRDWRFSLPSSTSLVRAWSDLFSSSLFCRVSMSLSGFPFRMSCLSWWRTLLAPGHLLLPFWQRLAERGIILWMLLPSPL